MYAGMDIDDAAGSGGVRPTLRPLIAVGRRQVFRGLGRSTGLFFDRPQRGQRSMPGRIFR